MVITSLQFGLEKEEYIQGNHNSALVQFYFFFIEVRESEEEKGEWKWKEIVEHAGCVDEVGAWWVKMMELKGATRFHFHSHSHSSQHFLSPSLILVFSNLTFWKKRFPFNSSPKITFIRLLDNNFNCSFKVTTLSLSSSLLFGIASFTTYVCIFWVNEILSPDFYPFLSLLLFLFSTSKRITTLFHLRTLAITSLLISPPPPLDASMASYVSFGNGMKEE